MTNFETFALAIGVAAAAYYLFIAASSKQYTRIRDLLMIGLILWISPYIGDIMSNNEWHSMKISGVLVFMYGWIIFITEKFLEGWRSKDSN